MCGRAPTCHKTHVEDRIQSQMLVLTLQFVSVREGLLFVHMPIQFAHKHLLPSQYRNNGITVYTIKSVFIYAPVIKVRPLGLCGQLFFHQAICPSLDVICQSKDCTNSSVVRVELPSVQKADIISLNLSSKLQQMFEDLLSYWGLEIKVI